MHNKKKIVFFGTPTFAVTSLNALLENQFNIVAVVTAVDKQKGRGKKLSISKVKTFAIEKKIPVLQPSNLKDKSFIDYLQSFNADLFVVVAFRMLPKIVWDMPSFGSINLHASLLPQYRGAAPINWAIINGESETGVTIFQLEDKIDTGDILSQKKINISNNDNAKSLHDKLMYLGSKLISDIIKLIFNNDISPIPQKSFKIKKYKLAPKIFKENCCLHWNQDASSIYNKIRGLSPYPGAYCEIIINERKDFLKIFKTKISDFSLSAGEIKKDKNQLFIGTNTFALEILEIQQSNKKRMTIKNFLNGLKNNFEMV